jgi:small-conductance mechanosensitive channel
MMEDIINTVRVLIESNLWKIVYSILVLIVARIFLIFVKPSVRKIDDTLEEIELSESTHKLIENAIKYIIQLIALVIILYIFGLTDVFYALLTGGAILGFAIGYASKDLISNMLAGILIALDRPFKIGDDVKILNVEGKVSDIKLRTTEIRTSEGIVVLIPNSKVLNGAIYNYTDGKIRK